MSPKPDYNRWELGKHNGLQSWRPARGCSFILDREEHFTCLPCTCVSSHDKQPVSTCVHMTCISREQADRFPFLKPIHASHVCVTYNATIDVPLTC